MSTTHDHAGHTHDALGVQRQDPTQTTTLRDQYRAQYHKRYRRLKGAVWQTVAEWDVLGLNDRAAANNDVIDPDESVDFPAPEDPPDLPGPLDPTPAALPNPEKRIDTDDYLSWFDTAQRRLVEGPASEGGADWSDEYVRYAYQKGVRDADHRSEQMGVISSGDAEAGISFRMPIHKQTIAEAIKRNRDGLKGVEEATTRHVRDVLTDAILEGQNAEKAARRINDRVESIGMTRAETHARTVIVGSYNEGALRRYEQTMGSDGGVTVLAEFSTANDGRVCPQCEQLEGNVYSVREAKGLIPVHPRCRCTWLPVQRGVNA